MMAVAVAVQQHIESLQLWILARLIVMIGAARLVSLLFRHCGRCPRRLTARRD